MKSLKESWTMTHVDLEGSNTYLDPLECEDKEQEKIHHDEDTNMETRRKV